MWKSVIFVFLTFLPICWTALCISPYPLTEWGAIAIFFPSKITTCEETKGLISGKTELERLCWDDQGCGWRAGWDKAWQEGGQSMCAMTSQPRSFPGSGHVSQVRVPSRETEPHWRKDLQILTSGGAPKKGQLTVNTLQQNSPAEQCCLWINF